jgi:hypothetical protein
MTRLTQILKASVDIQNGQPDTVNSPHSDNKMKARFGFGLAEKPGNFAKWGQK